VSTRKITPLSGFPEFLPGDRLVELQVIDALRTRFELHGFSSVETRAVEPVERLTDKGEDADNEIYALSRLTASDEHDEARLGLHFDLTVPFARYVLENAGKLTFPFRRYQIQKAWRGERPQDGRYREFCQADIDVVAAGELPLHYESELPLVVMDALAELPLPRYAIHTSNRKIAEGFYAGLGLTDVVGVLRIVDKLDKIGPDGVRARLLDAGATPAQADACLALAEIRTADASFVDAVRSLGVSNETLEEGLRELAAVVTTCARARPGTLVADLRIARGLDYYTGTVYEILLSDYPDYPAIGSGGRYDRLASDGKTSYPGIGLSVGVTRLVAKLLAEGLIAISRPTPTCVVVAVSDEDARADALALAARLRARGIATEVSPTAAKFGRQIRYADRRGIPYVWFAGAGSDGRDQVKDIRSGDQVEADADTWRPPDADLLPRLVPGLGPTEPTTT
jgi:histidyl-tRNA synthetase